MIYVITRNSSIMRKSTKRFLTVLVTCWLGNVIGPLSHIVINEIIICSSEKGRNHFEVLPEGWLQVTHNSGLPIYLHKTTRVCSVSRPYFLGPGSVRVRNFYQVNSN